MNRNVLFGIALFAIIFMCYVSYGAASDNADLIRAIDRLTRSVEVLTSTLRTLESNVDTLDGTIEELSRRVGTPHAGTHR